MTRDRNYAKGFWGGEVQADLSNLPPIEGNRPSTSAFKKGKERTLPDWKVNRPRTKGLGGSSCVKDHKRARSSMGKGCPRKTTMK